MGDYKQIGFGSFGGPLGFQESGPSAPAELHADMEEKDLRYLVENSCISCNHPLQKGSIKIVPPSYIQERDPYVRKGLVGKRMMCVSCYNNVGVTRRNKARIKSAGMGRRQVHPLIREALNSFLFEKF